ncbi:hypothetical protein D1872_238200 [compost metagenome]
MRQVAAMGKVHTKNSVSRLERSQINSKVGLSTGVRLNIGMLRSEQFFCTITSDIFNDVNMLTAAIVTFARISFSVFVRQNRTHSFNNRFAHDILGSDQFNVVALAFQLQIHCFQHCRVLFSQLIHCSTSSLENIINV